MGGSVEARIFSDSREDFRRRQEWWWAAHKIMADCSESDTRMVDWRSGGSCRIFEEAMDWLRERDGAGWNLRR